MCVLRELGGVRLLGAPGPQQPGVGDPPGHAAQSGRTTARAPHSPPSPVFVSCTLRSRCGIANLNAMLCFVPQNQAHRFLHRMGHSLVSGPLGNLWMYGGLSLSEGILGNVYR